MRGGFNFQEKVFCLLNNFQLMGGKYRIKGETRHQHGVPWTLAEFNLMHKKLSWIYKPHRNGRCMDVVLELRDSHLPVCWTYVCMPFWTLEDFCSSDSFFFMGNKKIKMGNPELLYFEVYFIGDYLLICFYKSPL